MVNRQYSGGHEPRGADNRANGDLDGDQQQVQVVSAAFLLQQKKNTFVSLKKTFLRTFPGAKPDIDNNDFVNDHNVFLSK